MSTAPDEATPRADRRRRTEAAILDTARHQFSEAGFERTTIRGVAEAAGVDPALVMQYFGNKAGLFAAAARWSDEYETVLTVPREQVPGAALADLVSKFEDADDREATVALLRNCLTHPEASRIMRDEVMSEGAAGVARVIGGDEAELRAGLLSACLIGLGMARYLFKIPVVADASREDLLRIMEPVLRELLGPDDRP